MLVAPADVDDINRTPDVVRCFAPTSLQPNRSVHVQVGTRHSHQ
ncbi:hypothetical protein [Rhodopila sp.]